MLSVFLSSTYEDLVEYRAKAANAIERLGQHPVRMEGFGARPSSATEASLKEIDSCDALIGIYAHRYGFVPKDASLSITEQEFDFANERKKPILVFVVEENFPWVPAHIDREPARTSLIAFKERVQSSRVRAEFTTPDDLAYKVASSLGRLLLELSIKEHLDHISSSEVISTERGRSQVARRATLLHGIIKGARVLLVNDVPRQMSGVINILNELGVIVEIATSSEEALSELSRNRFDLVISDMARDDVPDEGLQFLARMRNRNLSLPIIFTVGQFKPELGTPAYAFGITNHVDELLNLMFDSLERTRG
jgi:CheY-like chemotaxis protein